MYVSYPHLLPPQTEYKLEFWTPATLTIPSILIDSYDAGAALRDLSAKGEEQQRAAVTEANNYARNKYGIEKIIEFYDKTDDVFATHEPDPSPYSRNPDRWIHEFETTDLMEWYHPNPLGHEHWAEALSAYGDFGAGGGSFVKTADVDVAFVVDTTGSMGDDIAQVQADLSDLVAQLAATTDSYRVAVVSYRDFPERTGWYEDYPSKVIQTFTDDPVVIQSAIDFLRLSGTGEIGMRQSFQGSRRPSNYPGERVLRKWQLSSATPRLSPRSRSRT